MNKIFRILSLLLFILLLFSGCEALFKANLYSALDVKNYDLGDMSVDEMLAALNDDDFIEQLADSSDSDEIYADLMNDGTAESSGLAAIVAVAGTEGTMETINNFDTLITDALTDGTVPNFDTPEDVLGALFGSTSQADIEDQIQAMLYAAAAIEQYGDDLGSGNVPPALEDTNIGTIAIFTGLVGAMSAGGANDASEIATFIATGTPPGTWVDPAFDITDDTNSDGDLSQAELESNLSTMLGSGTSTAILSSTEGQNLLSIISIL